MNDVDSIFIQSVLYDSNNLFSTNHFGDESMFVLEFASINEGFRWILSSNDIWVFFMEHSIAFYTFHINLSIIIGKRVRWQLTALRDVYKRGQPRCEMKKINRNLVIQIFLIYLVYYCFCLFIFDDVCLLHFTLHVFSWK